MISVHGNNYLFKVTTLNCNVIFNVITFFGSELGLLIYSCFYLQAIHEQARWIQPATGFRSIGCSRIVDNMTIYNLIKTAQVYIMMPRQFP